MPEILSVSTLTDLQAQLANPDADSRTIYDYLVDHLSAHNCFVGMFSGNPCMFEAYGTLIEFSAVLPTLTGLGEFKSRIVEVLRTCNFTPLASVLAAYIESSTVS
jgi:hypothetical protein